MKLSVKKQLAALLAAPVLALGAASAATPAFAFNNTDLSTSGGANSAKGADQRSCLFGIGSECSNGDTPIFQTVANVLLFIIGAVSVIMLVVGGIRYTTSAGDSAQVTAAKNTIMYAIVGIIVALLAFAVVNFVIGSLAVPKA